MGSTPTSSAPRAGRRVRRLLDDAGASLVGRDVLALCSGGADSVALVALLGELPRGAAPRSLHVLWLDHGLRADVAAERAAAHAVADSIGATFHERRADVDLRTAAGGIEAAARSWRYDVASEVASAVGCTDACTGHTASDQLELALLSLVGVTGVPGDLQSMRVARGLAEGIRLVRPLLAHTRSETEAACRERGLAWAHDPSNDDLDSHVRNAVRHDVVPPLERLGPAAGTSIARAASRRTAERDLAAALASELLDVWERDGCLDVRRLARLDGPARRMVLAAWLRRRVPARDTGSRIVQAVEQIALAPARAACSRVDLPGGACVRRDGYDLRITTAHGPKGTRT
jgi:tRNA(Ile)-lysidine synthase